MSELMVLQQQVTSIAEKVDKILENLGTLIRVEERQHGHAERLARAEKASADHDSRIRTLELAQNTDNANSRIHAWVGKAVWAVGSALLTGTLMTRVVPLEHEPARKADAAPIINREERR